MNVAVTARSDVMSSIQLHVPVPAPGVPVSVTNVPPPQLAAHVRVVVPAELVQLIPGGAEVTDPVPLPAPCTVSINCCCPNVALTLRAWSMVTTHGRELAHVIP